MEKQTKSDREYPSGWFEAGDEINEMQLRTVNLGNRGIRLVLFTLPNTNWPHDRLLEARCGLWRDQNIVGGKLNKENFKQWKCHL